MGRVERCGMSVIVIIHSEAKPSLESEKWSANRSSQGIRRERARLKRMRIAFHSGVCGYEYYTKGAESAGEGRAESRAENIMSLLIFHHHNITIEEKNNGTKNCANKGFSTSHTELGWIFGWMEKKSPKSVSKATINFFSLFPLGRRSGISGVR